MPKKNYKINHLNKHIGNKIYLLRIANGISRNELAIRIDVTQQQIEKYEKNRDKISAGRLALIAEALNHNIIDFYADFDANNNQKLIINNQNMCMKIFKNFINIKNIQHKKLIYSLVKCLSNNN